jgi:hypothetical protein
MAQIVNAHMRQTSILQQITEPLAQNISTQKTTNRISKHDPSFNPLFTCLDTRLLLSNSIRLQRLYRHFWKQHTSPTRLRFRFTLDKHMSGNPAHIPMHEVYIFLHEY